jgi:hypothetical protein
MKKQFQILAATFITVVFISCSKEKVELTETPITTNEEIATSSTFNRTLVDPLTVKLDGWFTFNATLKDQTKKLVNAVSSKRLASFTYDRKGIANAALKLDSTYYLKLLNVPQQTETSISVWIKYGSEVAYKAFIRPTIAGAGVAQYFNKKISGQIHTPETHSAISTDQDNSWHHVVVTYDGAIIRLYIDGTLNTSVPHSNPGEFGPVLTEYFIGLHGDNTFWRGYIDDLRFYGRTLSASDVQKLFNQ